MGPGIRTRGIGEGVSESDLNFPVSPGERASGHHAMFSGSRTSMQIDFAGRPALALEHRPSHGLGE